MEKVCFIGNYLCVFYEFEPDLRFLKSLRKNQNLYPISFLYHYSLQL